MSTLDDLNQAVATRGGRWIKIRTTDDPKIDGEILEFEQRDKTDLDGNVVVGKKSGKPRIEWLFTLKVDEREDDDDDGIRKVPANESMQGAIAKAIKESGHQAEVGGRLQIAVAKNPEDDYSQADYVARYTPPALAVPTDDIFD